ncbi:DUF11 domain-containing protein [Deinococcus taeanensis]|uniref:DUF11 domain-containing protein n=1 Tax=Deinococcus taeanensis TaxID=2737050 RepID=UPI001CDC7ADF|nr:DUF11 domain-containing protein [Deinococcus taeanensis]UBV41692.1 DUF11 domain-containing protein [Deinococcus taeanensis]
MTVPITLPRLTPTLLHRRWLARLLGLLTAILGLLGLSGPAAALNAGAVSITLVSDTHLVSDSNNSCTKNTDLTYSTPKAAYQAFKITNTSGGTLINLKATLGITAGPAGTGTINTAEPSFGLAGNQAAEQYIGTLAAGSSRTLYWFITYPCYSGSAGISTASLTVTVADPDPITGTPTSTVSSSTTVSTYNSISANAGGQLSSSLLGAGAIVGQLIVYDASYSFGGTSPSDEFSLQPAGNPEFRADCLQLVKSQVTASAVNAIPVNSTDLIYFKAGSTNADRQSAPQGGNLVSVRYWFMYKCANTTTIANAFASSTSGNTNVKYTGNYKAAGFTISFPGATNAFSIAKTVTPTQLPAGGTVTYTVKVTNTSTQFGAYLDKVTDVLPTAPANVTLNSTTITGTTGVITTPNSLPSPGSTGTVTFLGTPLTSFFIPSGGVLTITYTATVPTNLGRYTNTATATTGLSTTPASSVTVQNGVTAFGVTKTHGTFRVGNYAAGATGGTYTLTVTNTGNLISSGTLTLTDTLPAGLTLATASGAGWTCTGTTSLTCTYSGAPLAVNGSTTLTLNVNVPTGITTNIVNTASVTGGGATGTAVSNTDTVTNANLSLSKTASVSSAPLNSNVTYTLTLTNTGPGAAAGVTVEDILPGSAQLVSADSAVTCVTSSSPVVCTWSPSTITANTTVTATIKVKMTADGVVSNSAQVKTTPNTFDPNSIPGNGTTNGEDDTSSVSVTVGGADVSITKTATSTVLPGGTVTYTLVVSNAGPSAAANVVITDVLPSSVTYQSWSVTPNGQAGTFSNSSGTLSWTHASLMSGATRTYTVLVKAPDAPAVKAGTTSVQNTATVSTDTFDPASGNNSSSGTTRMAYVELIKVMRNVTKSLPTGGAYSRSDGTAGNAMVPTAPGDVVEYCIDFRNYGAVTAANFTITDLVPANTATLAGSGTYTLNGGSSQVLPAGAVGSAGLSFTLPGTLSNGQYGRVCFRVKVNP